MEGCDFVPERPNERSDSTELAEVLAGTGWIARQEVGPSRRDGMIWLPRRDLLP